MKKSRKLTGGRWFRLSNLGSWGGDGGGNECFGGGRAVCSSKERGCVGESIKCRELMQN